LFFLLAELVQALQTIALEGEKHIVRTRPRTCTLGLVDADFQDAFLIFSSERVRPGVIPSESVIFMYRCHYPEREYDEVMRNCRVLVCLRAFPR